MVLTAQEKQTALEVIDVINKYAAGTRVLSRMFRALPDRAAWKEYYDVIPQPRSLDGVKANLEQDKYQTTEQIRIDLNLIFANALHFNEESSTIALDARTLQALLHQEWSSRPLLNPPPSGIAYVAPSPSTAPPPFLPSTQHALTPLPSIHIPAALPGIIPPAPVSGIPVLLPTGLDPVIAATEARMGIWEGPSTEPDRGWMYSTTPGRYAEILSLMKNYRVASTGERPAEALERIPEETRIPYHYHSDPISFAMIQNRVKSSSYATSQAFDIDCCKLFEKGRRLHQNDADSREYGRILLLQRMYNHLTSPSVGQAPVMAHASTNFTQVPAGPGTPKVVNSRLEGVDTSEDGAAVGITTTRIQSKDRTFTDGVWYKGVRYALGDFVHLICPDGMDGAGMPIIAQVYRTWIPKGGAPGQQGLTVCWYNRPEQTIHSRDRTFFEHEVMKSGHFADHALEDVLERCCVQFSTRYTRGRPLPPYWHPGWPLYICDQRYNDRDRAFVKIKNWASCIPEEVRNIEGGFMPITPFVFPMGVEDRVLQPRRVKSPYVTGHGIRGSGGLGAEGTVKAPTSVGASSGVTAAPSTPAVGSSAVVGTPTGTVVLGKDGEVIRVKRPYTKRGTGGKAMAAARAKAEAERLAAQNGATGGTALPLFHSSSATGGMWNGGIAIQPVAQDFKHARKIEDRTVVGAAGGPGYVTAAKIVSLPQETVDKFDRDPETGNLLWFSGPPVYTTPVAALRPKHSLTYLAFRARKQQKQQAQQDTNVNGKRPHDALGEDTMDVDDAEHAVVKPKVEELQQWRIHEDGRLEYLPEVSKNEVVVDPADMLAQRLEEYASALRSTISISS